MVKVAVYMTAFYLVYSIMLSRDTSYSRNRAFILLSLAAAMIFPFFTLQTIKQLDIQFFGKFLSEIFITATSNGTEALDSGSSAAGQLQIVYSIYIIGVIVLVFKLLIDLLNLLFLIARQKNKGSRIIRFHGFNTAGFSAMGYIFINTRLSPEDAGEIILHEQNHLRRNHFIDIIFIETIKAVQWFNPVVYLFNRSLRAIHEYQADKECLSFGVPVANYQCLLLSQVFKSRIFNLTNSFSNPSLIKKRMIMMTKKRTSSLASIKLLIVVPVIALVFLAISACRQNTGLSENQTNVITTPQSSQSDSRSATIPPPPPPPPLSEVKEVKKESKEPTIFVIVEEMPMFPGGDAALLAYLRENAVYPPIAKEKNIQGRVVLNFCVTPTGGVSKITVLKSVDPELDKEAIRVVSTLPKFKPGKQGGKPVPVWYQAFINFKLQ